MNALGEQSTSLWMDSAKLPDFPSLGADGSADVVVVGSGIAGLSTAYELCKHVGCGLTKGRIASEGVYRH